MQRNTAWLGIAAKSASPRDSASMMSAGPMRRIAGPGDLSAFAVLEEVID